MQPHCAGEGNINGFGLEFYIESDSSEIADTIHDVKKSWQFQLLYTVSQLAAGGFPSGLGRSDSPEKEGHLGNMAACLLQGTGASAPSWMT